MFEHARLRLTAWYLLIITFISLVFSVFIYRLFSREVDRFGRMQRYRLERLFQNLPPTPFDENTLFFLTPADNDLVREIKNRFILVLGGVNLGIIVTSGFLSYFLAGRTLDPIKKNLDQQNRFIGDASHELRTPITSLKSGFEISLRDPHLSLPEAKKVFRDSLTDINRLENLTTSLLHLNKSVSSDSSVKFSKISVSSVISAAALRLRHPAAVKEIAIRRHLSSGLFIYGHREKLTELFTILLDNAIKYSPPKTTIDITSNLHHQSVVITVADQGSGIDPKDLPHIFDRFYRSDPSRSQHSVPGFGLGLAIAKDIIELHHGRIDATSHLGQGSCFTINLPAFS